jgi:hypothetical protein
LKDYQRGFTEGKSTFDNCIDLIIMMEEGKTRERAYRRAKTLVSKRIKQYILFIDFRKAFDKVNREKLLKKMLLMGFSKALVIAI